MKENSREWRFMRRRAEQLYEEGEIYKALRMIRLMNREQAMRFEKHKQSTKAKSNQKIVSTH